MPRPSQLQVALNRRVSVLRPFFAARGSAAARAGSPRQQAGTARFLKTRRATGGLRGPPERHAASETRAAHAPTSANAAPLSSVARLRAGGGGGGGGAAPDSPRPPAPRAGPLTESARCRRLPPFQAAGDSRRQGARGDLGALIHRGTTSRGAAN
ncbi:unnamed protein product [Prorocentrum cordatum]|uniref:Uncharacterized protein n=1 Tax=Prorocentrum cordatum TaxID=2364126 RepID=A0ABN9T8D8_9DINO|nr:unnamed protein product [Polarella glacialis]